MGISSNGEIGEVELVEKMIEQEFIVKLNSDDYEEKKYIYI